MKIDFRKSILFVLLTAFPLSFFLVWIGRRYLLSVEFVCFLYAAVILTATFAWALRLMYLQTRLERIEDILYEERNPFAYVSESEKLLCGIRSNRVKPLIWLNMSAGYAALNVFHMADKILDAVKAEKLTGINQAIYYCTKAQYAFCRGNLTEGIQIVEEKERILLKYLHNSSLKCRIATVFAFYHLALEEPEMAKQYTQEAEKSCLNAYRMDMVDYLKMRIALENKRYQEAKGIQESLFERGMVPLLREMVMEWRVYRKVV